MKYEIGGIMGFVRRASLSESGFTGLWDLRGLSGVGLCQNRDFQDYGIYGIRPARVFVRKALVRYLGWLDLRLWRKAQAGRIEILKIRYS